MHNLFLVYFVNFYMFRAYLDPSSGGTTVCIQQLVLIILLDDCFQLPAGDKFRCIIPQAVNTV